jgi:cell division protein FtsB
MRFTKGPPWLKSRWTILILAIILLTVSGLELNQWHKRAKIQKEIDALIAQQQELEQKNKDLATSLDLLNTKDYKEKIAREQLNLKKDGEIVVNFSQATQPEQSQSQASESNPQKWWQYFFQQ